MTSTLIIFLVVFIGILAFISPKLGRRIQGYSAAKISQAEGHADRHGKFWRTWMHKTTAFTRKAVHMSVDFGKKIRRQLPF